MARIANQIRHDRSRRRPLSRASGVPSTHSRMPLTRCCFWTEARAAGSGERQPEVGPLWRDRSRCRRIARRGAEGATELYPQRGLRWRRGPRTERLSKRRQLSGPRSSSSRCGRVAAPTGRPRSRPRPDLEDGRTPKREPAGPSVSGPPTVSHRLCAPSSCGSAPSEHSPARARTSRPGRRAREVGVNARPVADMRASHGV